MLRVNLPKIYDFQDYREYLNEIFNTLKENKISKRAFAKEIGFSNAYITMVLKKKRNLDLTYIDKIGEYLNLRDSEKKYFENLCILADSDQAEERSEAFRKLSRFKTYQKKSRSDVVTHKYLNHWHYVAIREMSFLDDFCDDPDWIQSRLIGKISKRDIEQALNFLKKNKLLNGQEMSHLDCSEGIYRLALGRFHREMLGQVTESIEKIPSKKRSIMGFSKAMNLKNFSQAVKIMEDAIKQINNLEVEEKTKELYHFYFTGIPLTSKEDLQ